MEGDKLPAGQEHVVVKTVTIHNYVMPTVWHRIDIVEALTIRVAERRKPVKSWTKKSSKAVYAWEDQEVSTKPAADYWTKYRHELEQFVNRTKKREGSGWWMDGEGSIEQMKTVDSAYEKAGLPLRRSNT
jgi:hypothetical protein